MQAYTPGYKGSPRSSINVVNPLNSERTGTETTTEFMRSKSTV